MIWINDKYNRIKDKCNCIKDIFNCEYTDSKKKTPQNSNASFLARNINDNKILLGNLLSCFFLDQYTPYNGY